MSYNIGNLQLRNEKKFIFFEPPKSIEKLLNFIGTKEVYNSRIVNSIYFDTYFHKNFNEAIDGIMLRNKIRVRWYGEIFNVEIQPQIENKITQSGNRFVEVETKCFIKNYKILQTSENFKRGSLSSNLVSSP